MARKRRLTVKQKRFCDYYVKTGNATEAARKAGYSEKTARFIGAENLTKPNIKAHIDARLKEIEDSRIADMTEVLKRLTTAARGELEEEVVVVENTGDYESKARMLNKKVSAKDQLKALELLGKRYGLFTDRLEVDGDIAIKIIDDIEADTDEG